MRAKHLVVVGASSGGIETLRELVAKLPAEFSAPIAVVLHSAPEAPGILHEILARSGQLPAVSPHDGETLRPGTIYVAPPDFHLVVEPGRLRVTRGPRENRFRPAIDPLFRSAAQVYGPAAIGVILSGSLDDGAAGLWAIKQLGGTAIVQDPEDALYSEMPRAAIQATNVDYCVPVRDMAPLLMQRVGVEVPAFAGVTSGGLDIEVKIAKEEEPMAAGVCDLGPPSTFSCPECHGVLRELKEGNRVRFRCHTGHAYSAESLLAEINAAVETALWNAIRSMHEGTLLMRGMARHAEEAHPASATAKLTKRAKELERQGDVLREMVTGATEISS